MFTAGDVFTGASAALNDQAQAIFTDAVQMPYLNMAILDLKRSMELNNVPVTNETSTVIPIPALCVSLGIGTPPPALPANLVEIQQLFQRQTGTNDRFLPVTKFSFLPHYVENTITNEIAAWAWMRQEARFVPASSAIDIKIDYIADVLPQVMSESDEILILNALGYLQYRTAGHCAFFVGSNETRAQGLYGLAESALGDVIGISSKSKQNIFTRRRPFRASYRNRGSAQ